MNWAECTPNYGEETQTCVYTSATDVSDEEIECTENVVPNSGIEYVCTVTQPLPSSGAGSGGELAEDEAMAALNAAGVTVVSSGNCTDPNHPTCTGVEGLQQSTIDNIVTMAEACPDCGFVMTAGTEVGHTNSCHQNGTCADIDCRPNVCTVDQINRSYDAAAQNGLQVVYEVANSERKRELVEQGVDPNAISVVSWITGEHFSLYNSN